MTLLVVLLNVGLAVLLIFGGAGFPPQGITGAASATVIATAVGTLLYLWLFVRRGRREGMLAHAWLPFERHTCWQLVRVSWPIGAHGVLEMAAWTLFTALAARLGVAEAAAHAIALRLVSFPYTVGYGIAVAATTLVGQALGA